MTPQERAKQQAEVMLAYANGAELEVHEDGTWYPIIEPFWDWKLNNYRVKKPAPKVVKLEAWLTNSNQLCLFRADSKPNVPSWKRIPSLDLEYTEDES